MEQFNYAEYVVGGLTNRNAIFRTSDFKLNGERVDCFRSLFLCDEGLQEYVRRTGSVASYAGEHTSDALIFDFDGVDLNAVKKSALTFCQYLRAQFDLPLSHVRIAFSGSKGFHVSVPITVFGEVAPRRDFYKVYKGIAEDLADGFEYVDRSIYERRRIMRMANTINSKSGLYKIPLSFGEFEIRTIAEIVEMAHEVREVEHLPASEMLPIEPLRAIYQKWASTNFDRMERRHPSTNPTEGELASLLRGVPKGERNCSAMKLVGFYLSKGFDQAMALEHARLWNLQNQPPMEAGELDRLVAGAYMRYRRNEPVPEVYDLQQAERIYREYAKTLDKCSVKTGFPTIDQKMRGIMPGETVSILGKTAVGKSGVLQQIGLHHAEVSGEPVLFFSLEMPITSVFERALQFEIGISGREVESAYRSDDPELAIQANLVFAKVPNFYTVTRSGLTVETIKRIVLHCEQNVYRRKTSLILLDYLGLVQERGTDIYQQISRVARSLKDAAKELNVPVIYLSQVNRKFKDCDPLEIGAARDSGAVDEASDFVLGLWREQPAGFGLSLEIKLVLGLLKNRKGGTGEVGVVMDKRTLRFAERTRDKSLSKEGEPF